MKGTIPVSGSTRSGSSLSLGEARAAAAFCGLLVSCEKLFISYNNRALLYSSKSSTAVLWGFGV